MKKWGWIIGGLWLSNVQAADWSSTSLLLHQGATYQQSAGKQTAATVMTFEHANAWGYGSNFFFVDVTNPNSTATHYYGEFSPTLSWNKSFAAQAIDLPGIKDVMLAANWEMSAMGNGKHVGVGVAWEVPGFAYFNSFLYQRHTESAAYQGLIGSGQQLSLAWGAPFHLGATRWLFEGFLDYASAEPEVEKAANLLTDPRLLLDVGALWFKPDQLYTGVEYRLWHNKYGIEGLEERVVQWTIKWHF